MTAAQRLREQGIEQGLQQGIEQGIEQGLQQGIEQGLQQGLQQGIEQGLQQGIEQGLQTSRMVLLRHVQHRFGAPISPDAEQRLRAATLQQIEAWSLRLLTATSLAEVFAD
jgi:hypothetical protein